MDSESVLDGLANSYVTVTLSTLGVVLLAYTLYTRANGKRYKLPPGPPNLPLVGCLPYLGKDIREPLRKMAEKYGEMMTVYLGLQQTVYLNTFDAIKDAFVKHGQLFSGRPQDFFIFQELCDSSGVIATEGEFWREQRRFTHTVLKDLGIGKIRLEPQILEEVQFYLRELEALDGAAVNPDLLIRKAIGNVIYTVVNGSRNSYSDPEYDKYIRDMATASELIGGIGALVAFPFLRYLPGDVFRMRDLLADREINHRRFIRHINEHRETLDPDNPRDFMDLYLIKMAEQQDNPNNTFSDRQLNQIIADLFGGGTDTSVHSLIWTLIYMLHNPKVMARCQREIDDVIGRHRAPSMKDKASMPYTEATLMEASRLTSVAAFGIMHTNIEETEFRGYSFPVGTIFMANLYAVHRDPVTWPEPEVFKPTRHLTDDGKITRNEQLIPFSIGRRVCLGESLARMNLFLFFTSILQRFDLSQPEGNPLPPLVGEFQVLHVAPKIKIIFKERKSEQ